MRIEYFFFLLTVSFLVSCSTAKPKQTYENYSVPLAPDYSNLDFWAAHPSKLDSADRIPILTFSDVQTSSNFDVFFLHPTTFTGSKGEKEWNGPVNDQELNEKTDGSAILYQASIFNGTGRVFAPRYRQAHLHSYFTKDKKSAMKAFRLAYQDVKKAFDHYLATENNGRPIIIASHSQGTNHATQILKDYFDNGKLKDQLVVAYLVGMPIAKDTFKTIQPCETAFDVNCFCSWRTFKSGHLPSKLPLGNHIAVHNPLTWSMNTTLAPAALNVGGMARKFYNGIIPGLNDAKVHNGILWASKPKFPGSIFITFKNYHIADYNLFYSNIRQNAKERSKAFELEKNAKTILK